MNNEYAKNPAVTTKGNTIMYFVKYTIIEVSFLPPV